MKHIVKRKGHKEEFDIKKIHTSVLAACRSSHLESRYAKKIATAVEGDMKRWIKNKKTVSSTQIFHKTTECLKKHSEDAAFMYSTHRDIS